MKRVIARIAEAEREKEAVITKAKGEVVDEWYRVILTKDFCNEREPDTTAIVTYTVEQGAFPEPIENEDEVDF